MPRKRVSPSDSTEYQKAYHMANREQRIAKAKAWNDANPDKVKARTVIRGLNLTAKRLGCTVEDLLSGKVERPKAGRPRGENGKPTPPALLESMMHRYRLLRAHPTDITKEWLRELRATTVICGVCGEWLSDPVHLDHIISLFDGGRHLQANVRYVHAKCNLKRPKSELPK